MPAMFPSGRGGRRRAWVLGLVVALAAGLPYLRLPAQPLIYDAALAILGNAAVQTAPLGDLFVVDFWGRAPDSATVTRSWRPLASLSYAIEARTAGNAAWLYHAIDIGLHALVSVLVLRLLVRLGIEPLWAVTGALLFALHPVQTEAVCSAVGRADLLAVASFIAALLLHLDAPRRSVPIAREAGSLALLAASLLSKEYAVAFPFLLMIVDAARARAGVDTARPRRARLGYGLASLLLLALYLGVRLRLFGAFGGVPALGAEDHPLFGKPLSVRWATGSSLLLLAGRLLVAPLRLNHHYRGGTLSIPDGLLSPAAAFGLLLAGLLVALAVARLVRANDPLPMIAVALFLLPLAPSLNVVSLAGVLFAERFLYLPCAGLALAVGCVASRLVTGLPARCVATVVAAGALALLALGTSHRVRDWSSIETLSRASLAAYPRGEEVWEHLGLSLLAQHREEEAVGALERSVELNPNRPRALTFQARALFALGRYDEAARALRRATELLPRAGPLWQELGEAERKAGRPTSAVEPLEQAARLMPRNAATLALLVRALLDAERPEAALERLDRARELLGSEPAELARLRDEAERRRGPAPQ